MAEVQGNGAVVVTGASTGIGEACALRLDKQGFRVFAGVRKSEDGERLKQQTSDRLSPVIIDVVDEASIAAAAAEVASATGDSGLVGLINNAGIALGGPLEFLPVAELRRQLEVNVIGQIAVTQAFMPLLRKGNGRVVNIGSDSGRLATPFLGPYCASKFAMEALTDSLRQELRPWGIEVSIIQPGSITTPIWEKARTIADDVVDQLPPRAHELYEDAIEAIRTNIDEMASRGIPADEVAKAAERALTARKPKTRYAVGRDAWIAMLLSRLAPDRLRDRLVAWQMGLSGKA